MTITKTIHPPAGATAMIAATQVEITVMGWYYIPVVMLSAALAIAVGLLTNNIQRRYPVFWLVPNKIPVRQRRGEQVEEHHRVRRESDVRRESEAKPVSPQILPTSTTLTSGESEAQLKKTPTWIEDERNAVVVTAQQIVVPDFLDLEEENLEVLEEVQRMIREHLNGNGRLHSVDGRTVTNGENAV